MTQRANQVAEELRKIISMIFIQDLNNPRLGFLTITKIEMTPDLRLATVFYSVLGDEAQKELTKEALAENIGFIRKLAVERINMRYAMDIRFELDKSIEDSFKIDAILKKIKEEEKS